MRERLQPFCTPEASAITFIAASFVRCSADVDSKAVGCRYWLMLADNKRASEKETPDVSSFLIFDSNGKRVAYGTGPVIKGDVAIMPSAE